jgi:hypothetical protein
LSGRLTFCQIIYGTNTGKDVLEEYAIRAIAYLQACQHLPKDRRVSESYLLFSALPDSAFLPCLIRLFYFSLNGIKQKTKFSIKLPLKFKNHNKPT